jgi:two-component system sensor histidine kinase BaeS
MLNTLRRRLILSHILPVLLIIPLMGIALIYVIETQSMGSIPITGLSSEMTALLVRLRVPVVIVLGTGLFLGVLVGWTLALEMERPLGKLTQTVIKMRHESDLPSIPKQGPQEIQQLSRAIRDLVEHRRRLEQDRRRLLANLVHELGRPLGALYSATQACRHGAYEQLETRQSLLEGMEAELLGLRRLVDDLSLLRDTVVGDFRLQRRETPIDQWLAQTSNLWQEAAEEKGIVWETYIPADLPELNLDPERLNQALGNLISNAIKYTPSGGKVLIQAGSSSGTVWIRVSDTGPGMPPEELEHIFTPFYRGRQSDGYQAGLGLGLSIARDLVAAHQGRLEVSSTPGQGSDFTIWLPVTVSGIDHHATLSERFGLEPGGDLDVHWKEGNSFQM